MCGIFGVISGNGASVNQNELDSIVRGLFKLSETRGKESAGIAIKNTNSSSISVLKKSVAASKLVSSEEYKQFFQEATTGLFDPKGNKPFSIIAHARLVTNGSQENNNNNQPCIKSGSVAVHNGIITNVDALWEQYVEMQREYEVDTEVLVSLIRDDFKKNHSISDAVIRSFKKVEGTASVAILSEDIEEVILATNNGSLYYSINEKNDVLIFASESFILKELIKKENLSAKGFQNVNWLKPGFAFTVNVESFYKNEFLLDPEKMNFSGEKTNRLSANSIKNYSPDEKVDVKPVNYSFTSTGGLSVLSTKLEFNIDAIKQLKRCSKCLLPETFPYLTFDSNEVCSYCNSYMPQKHIGLDKLKERADQIRSKDGKPDCLVMFSGGRDSSYGLHFIKQELNLNPIAYTYDWGMVTDLARRNQARICGKLGVEHILVSADIAFKRSNIRKNVSAWLKRPSLGTIPLFMAGDKQFFYYANYLSKINDLKVILMCENMLETTSFKSGFAGVKPNFGKDHNYYISFPQKMKMLSYYAKEFLLNPAYINSSLLDTLSAFKSYYFIPHDYFNIFNYFPWKEQDVEDTLLREYEWETSPDTTSTWRIGDGTAAFYNYIYYTVAGFSEFDTFRSNQIREGLITREEALEKVNIENRPRFESIKWYLETIGIDFEKAIHTINAIPKLYEK